MEVSEGQNLRVTIARKKPTENVWERIMYQERENKMGSAGDVKGHETSAGEMAFHISGSVMRKAPAQSKWGQGQKEVE